jgi:hypothetical protein
VVAVVVAEVIIMVIGMGAAEALVGMYQIEQYQLCLVHHILL